MESVEKYKKSFGYFHCQKTQEVEKELILENDVEKFYITEDGYLDSYQILDKSKFSGNVIIPDGVKEIGSNTFIKNTKIKSVVIPNGVEKIWGWAFALCPKLTSVTIPSTVKSIGFYAFNKCNNLKDIIIPDNIKYIGQNAFQYCENLSNESLLSIKKGNDRQK